MESDRNLRSYVLALLTLMRNQAPPLGQSDAPYQPLGMALRVDTQTSVYCVSAHILLQALIEHSPSQETVSQHFMVELAKCENKAVVDSGDTFSTLRDVLC
jgi:hypothetical protein